MAAILRAMTVNHIDALYLAVSPLLLDFLRGQPGGIKEHDLLDALANARVGGFVRNNDAPKNLDLFQRHFLLFHLLYRLRADVADQHYLDIHVLRIQLLPLTDGASAALAEHDPLAEYYLNLANLEETGASDVEQMIDAFWDRYAAFVESADCREILGVTEASSATEVEAAYRRLAMQHHPDRGGDPEQFRRIQSAWQQVKKSF